MDDDGYFDERIAAVYDDDDGIYDPAVIDTMVDFLAELAGDGAAVEFGIGTGRIALPLAARGVPVSGIDLSKAMVARLKQKPGAEAIGTTIGDFATTRAEGSFGLVYLIFNTINNLTSQAAQVACFRNAAAHLAPGGCFLIEVGIPRLQELPRGETLIAFDVGERHWGVDEYDVVNQGLISHHLRLVDGEDGGPPVAERHSIPFRYVWPAELDLMAELAGMRLRERCGGWQREPFTAMSKSHVSVWEKLA